MSALAQNPSVSSVVKRPLRPAICFDLASCPPDIHDALAQEPEGARREVLLWLRRCERIHTAGHGEKQLVYRAIAQDSGLTISGVKARYRKFLKEGPLGLINRAKFKLASQNGNGGLPKQFLEYWRALVEDHQRDTTGKAAWEKLGANLRAWRRHPFDPELRIAGYDSPPQNAPGCLHPAGWSYENLIRHVSDLISRKARRQGRGAARELLPDVLTTRVGYLPGQVVFFDDQWHDVYVRFGRSMTRVVGFNALDLASGCMFAHGTKPIRKDAEPGDKVLNKSDALFFIVHLLTHYGYRADTGTVIVGEAGTAGADQEFRDCLHAATNGKVNFHAGNVDNRSFANLGFKERPKGNPRVKARMECWFRILRERTSHLIGQTGRKPELEPSETYGLKQYVKHVLDQFDRFPSEIQDLFRLPIHPYHRFTQLLSIWHTAINQRTDHQLEGWEQLGHCEIAYRLPDLHAAAGLALPQQETWISEEQFLSLPPTHQELILAGDPDKTTRLVRRSPLSVWEDHLPGLTKVSPYKLNLLIPKKFAHTVTVTRDHWIRIRDRQLRPDDLLYDVDLTTAQGETVTLRAGREVLVYLNPYAIDQILVCRPDGAAIGLAHRREASGYLDTAGLESQIVKRETIYADLTREARRRAEPKAKQRAADKAHNQTILDGGPATPEEKAEQRRVRSRVSRADETAIPEDIFDLDGDPGTGTEPEDTTAFNDIAEIMAYDPELDGDVFDSDNT